MKDRLMLERLMKERPLIKDRLILERLVMKERPVFRRSLMEDRPMLERLVMKERPVLGRPLMRERLMRGRPVHPRSLIQKQQPKRGVKKMYCTSFFCSHKYHKIENYSIFELVWKKIWAILYNFLAKQLSLRYQKYSFRIRNKPIPDPGSRGQKRHRVPDPNPQHCYQLIV
jgi:hypothetical protein